MFIDKARERGFYIDGPEIVRLFHDYRWSDVFDYHKDLDFVLFINNTHPKYGLVDKKGHKAVYKISVTQNVLYNTIVDIVEKKKFLTLENIINKTNCKFFGINYEPSINRSAIQYDLGSNNVLVFGLDVAHPPAATMQERAFMKSRNILGVSLKPSIVGISANVAQNPYTFVGDYYYQQSGKESIDTLYLTERVVLFLKTLERERPNGARPKWIFVLRDGLSEGQGSMAVKEELVAIRQGCQWYSPNYNPKIVFAIGTKRHFKRFYGIASDAIVNIGPGTVVEDKFTRCGGESFELQAAYPLRGVPKPVSYFIPVNEIEISQENFQDFLLSLCFNHQIINQAISLPEPIHQADELAKRGQNNFNTMKLIEEKEIPYLPTKEIDLRALNHMLNYQGRTLFNTRFTA